MTLSVWIGTFAVFAVLMAADLTLTRKATGLRAAATSSALWIAAAVAFGGALWLWRGPGPAGQYFAGYLLEKALSVDNVFVFGVTRDMFVVFTSNAFAVLGLRALYFLLAGSVDRFAYLKPAIALLLVFIGTKMLISPVVHLPVWVSLAAIAVVVGGAVTASLRRDRRHLPRPVRR